MNDSLEIRLLIAFVAFLNKIINKKNNNVQNRKTI